MRERLQELVLLPGDCSPGTCRRRCFLSGPDDSVFDGQGRVRFLTIARGQVVRGAATCVDLVYELLYFGSVSVHCGEGGLAGSQVHVGVHLVQGRRRFPE